MANLPSEIKRKQFLVTDDNDDIRNAIAADLYKLGIQKIIFATSGNQAFEIVKSKKDTLEEIEFIVTDLVMENGTGMDLVTNLRADLNFEGLPVLMLSSKAEVNQVIQCVKIGVNAYVVKPWEIEILAKKIIECNSKVKSKPKF